jgi:hypothetical protein
MVTSNPDTHPSLILIEPAFTLIALITAFGLPKIGSRWFSLIERAFGRLACRKRLSVAIVGTTAFFLRLAILPFCSIPLSFVQDDFQLSACGQHLRRGKARQSHNVDAFWKFRHLHATNVYVDVLPRAGTSSGSTAGSSWGIHGLDNCCQAR